MMMTEQTYPIPQLSGRTLLCLDFDVTLTLNHLFQTTANAIINGYPRDRAILLTLELLEQQGPRGGHRLWEVLHLWLRSGHGIAVTSFTAFPELPSSLLAWGVPHLRALEASRNITRWLSRPVIIYGDPAPQLNPPSPQPNTILVSADQLKTARSSLNGGDDIGKNLHIRSALSHLEKSGERFDDVLLLDDDPNNIAAAARVGYHVIQASTDPEDLTHLRILDQCIQSK